MPGIGIKIENVKSNREHNMHLHGECNKSIILGDTSGVFSLPRYSGIIRKLLPVAASCCVELS